MWYTSDMAMRKGDPLDPNNPDDERHGTLNGYTNYHCICAPCRKLGRAYFKKKARERRQRGLPAGSKLHGTEGGYSNYGCKCELCSKARADYAAGWRARKKEEGTSARVQEVVRELEARGTAIHRIIAAREAGLI